MATAVARLPSRTKPSPIYTPIYYTKLKDGKLQELVFSIEGSLPDTLIEELAVAKEKSGREALKSARHYQHLDAQISNDEEETTEDEAVDSLEAQISNMAMQMPAIDISDVTAAMTSPLKFGTSIGSSFAEVVNVDVMRNFTSVDNIIAPGTASPGTTI